MLNKKIGLLKRSFDKHILLFYFVSRVLVEILNLFTFRRFERSLNAKAMLCIEAGRVGWEHIDYCELFASAEEYIGEGNVAKVVIDKAQSYVGQVVAAIKKSNATHYLYDARSGSQEPITGLIEAFKLAMYFQLNGVVPICLLTDFPYRPWRRQVAMVSAKRGIVLSLMCPREVGRGFPHRRILGPITMAFSRKTLHYLDKTIEDKPRSSMPSLIFVGSLYEPRRSTLNLIKNDLLDHGITLEMRGRNIGNPRSSNDDYWGTLVSATMIITTGSQLTSELTDGFSAHPHLIYRYLEAPAAGAVLVAQNLPSLRRYLTPDVDFISFDTPEDAVKKIAYFFNRPEELKTLAENGRRRVSALINCNYFWCVADAGLHEYPLC